MSRLLVTQDARRVPSDHPTSERRLVHREERIDWGKVDASIQRAARHLDQADAHLRRVSERVRAGR